jgi:hypothetical protein
MIDSLLPTLAREDKAKQMITSRRRQVAYKASSFAHPTHILAEFWPKIARRTATVVIKKLTNVATRM